jgi:hypothetical protein
MNRLIVAMALAALAGTVSAQSTPAETTAQGMSSGMSSEPPMMVRKPCEELKSEIDAKIKKNGVPMYTLDVVDMDMQAEGKVVGTCDGQTKKIVYKRG